MTDSAAREAPTTWGGTLRHLGPGLIISAALVGSGELVATTKLGAQVGFTLLWLIILGCLLKVFLQIEMARYAISSGETTLTAFNRVPGPLSLFSDSRFAQLPLFRANWVVWTWFIAVALTYAALGGIIGGVVQAIALGFDVNQQLAAVVMVLFTISILIIGKYKGIETTATVLVVSFTIVTLGTAVGLQATPYRVSMSNIVGGLTFELPPGDAAVATAVATFGLIGVTASDIVSYPYWCVEKGYARFTGKRTNDAAWLTRARGWVRVMRADAIMALTIYTTATLAFYMIGAAVLNRQGLDPDGMELVSTLTEAYVPVFGSYAKWLLVVGAAAILYSTYLVVMGASARSLTDLFTVIGVVDRTDKRQMQRSVSILSVFLPVATLAIYLTGLNPVRLIVMGGIVQALFLPVVAVSVLYLRYRVTDPGLRPGRAWDAALLASSLSFVIVGGFSIYRLFGL